MCGGGYSLINTLKLKKIPSTFWNEKLVCSDVMEAVLILSVQTVTTVAVVALDYSNNSIGQRPGFRYHPPCSFGIVACIDDASCSNTAVAQLEVK